MASHFQATELFYAVTLGLSLAVPGSSHWAHSTKPASVGSLTPKHSPAVHSDGPILAKLLLGFMDLPNEVNEALACFWYSLLRPVSELELSDGS